MEERVKFLESELIKFAESFEELTYHYSTIHNFLLAQFGDKFKQFVLGENVGAADATELELNQDFEDEGHGNGGDEGDGDEHEQLEQNEYNDNDEEEGLEFPTDILDINVVDPGEDENDEFCEDEESRVQVTRVPQSSSQNKGEVFKVPGNAIIRRIRQNTPQLKVEARSIKSGVVRTIKHPPPPLIRRPGTTSQFYTKSQIQASSKGGGSQIIRKVQTPRNTVTIRPVVGGNRGNEILLSNEDEDFRAGKYSKFYRKVNDELIQCKMCQKILKRRGKFIQHLRTHTGEKPFQCEYCPAAFSRKDNMNVHVSKHHSLLDGNQVVQYQNMIQPNYMTSSASNSNNKSPYGFKCQICSKQFANENIFHAHLKLVHSITGDDEEAGGENNEEIMQMKMEEFPETDYLEEGEDEGDFYT